MKTIAEQMMSYSSYHRDARNKLTHVFGIPLVTFSILIPLAWFRFAPMDVPFSMATVFVFFVSLYYLRLDWQLMLIQMPFSLALLFAADTVARLPFQASITYFFAAFVGGWVIQLLGHVFEGKRPALADNILQVFNAPLFLALELLFVLGFRRDMRAKIESGCQ